VGSSGRAFARVCEALGSIPNTETKRMFSTDNPPQLDTNSSKVKILATSVTNSNQLQCWLRAKGIWNNHEKIMRPTYSLSLLKQMEHNSYVSPLMVIRIFFINLPLSQPPIPLWLYVKLLVMFNRIIYSLSNKILKKNCNWYARAIQNSVLRLLCPCFSYLKERMRMFLL
jgi:hypothetical protein